MSRARRRWCFGLAVALGVALLGEGAARAEQPSRPAEAPATVRLRYADGPAVAPLVTRLAAELKVAGFGVEPAPEGASADGAEPYAEVRLAVERERAELRITSRASGATSHVELVGTLREGPALCLQATEFLRAGLLPRVFPPEGPRSGRGAPPAAPPPSLPARGRAFGDVGGGWLTNLRSADGLWLLSLGAGYAFPQRLAISAGADVPLGGETFRTAQGAADYRLWGGAVRADYAWLRFAGGQLALGLGLGVARVTTAGRPTPPLEGVRSGLWALSLDARLSFQVRVSSELAVFARARVLTLSPNPVVALLDEERRLGAPALSFELGARLGGERQVGAGAFKR